MPALGLPLLRANSSELLRPRTSQRIAMTGRPQRLQRRNAIAHLQIPPEFMRDRPSRTHLNEVMARRVISSATTKALEREMDTCTICLDGYSSGDEVACMPCLHKMHWKCLEQWLDRGANTCPTCRWSITKEPGSDRPSLMERGESELDRLGWSGESGET